LLFESCDEEVLSALVEAVVDVPYLALATKKQLFECIDNSLGLGDHTSISEKEIKNFVSRLFEMKKPIKKTIISLLNEKYGINILNLKETATFKSLAHTQVVIFESLSRLAPKGSVLKEVFTELSMCLKKKNGVEVIDVNDVLQECFEACGYDNFCEEYTLVENISFDTILNTELSIAELLEKTRKTLLLDLDKEKDNDKTDAQIKAEKDLEDREAQPESESDEEDDSVKAAEKKKKKTAKEEVELDGDNIREEEEAEEDEAEEEQALSKEEFLEALNDLDELMAGMQEDDDEEEPHDDEEESDDGDDKVLPSTPGDTPEEEAEE
jgi:flagellar biosynthesis GTPase FlhF